MIALKILLLEIGLALILAKIFGYGMEKLKQPAVIGEILAGIFLGPFILGSIFNFNFISPSISNETETIAQIGIILLLFLSGIETGVGEIKEAGKSGMITSFFDVFMAFLFGYIVGTILGYDTLHSIAIGNIFTATSVGITVRTLMDMNALHTNVGNLILTVAVLDDILGIIVLSVTLGKGSVEMLFVKIAAFFAIFFILLLLLYKYQKFGIHVSIPKFALTIALALCFICSALALSLGLAAITGSFFAGLLLSAAPQRRRISEFIREIGDIFFIPLFFVWVGASFDFSALEGVGMLILLFIPFALAGKIIGCSLGAKITGFSNRDAISVGVGMMPRLEVALIVVTTEISMGIWDKPLAHQVLAATILLVIISSLITPFALKAIYKPQK
ncbi:MAG: cation:proton antiporter [Deltaproteobacteria bacterium]|nr:MAG: cation:proton antiporter [Deltaproteobacteria bacterium]